MSLEDIKEVKEEDFLSAIEINSTIDNLQGVVSTHKVYEKWKKNKKVNEEIDKKISEGYLDYLGKYNGVSKLK
jgi:hypothetical protein